MLAINIDLLSKMVIFWGILLTYQAMVVLDKMENPFSIKPLTQTKNNRRMETEIQFEVLEKKTKEDMLKILVTGEEDTKAFSEKLAESGNSVEFFALKGDFLEEKLPFTFRHLKPALDFGGDQEHDMVIAVDQQLQKISLAVRKDSESPLVLLNIHQVSALLLDRWLSQESSKNPVCLKSLHLSEMVEQMAVKSDIVCHNRMIPDGELAATAKEIKFDSKNEYLIGFNEDQEIFHSEKSLLEIVEDLIAIEAEQRENEKTMFDHLVYLYTQYGFFKEKTVGIDFNTKSQRKHLLSTMDDIRKNPKILYDRFPIESITDHLKGKKKNILTGKIYEFPAESFNILKVEFPDNFTLTFAPTESKMYYFTSVRVGITSKDQYEDKNRQLDKEIMKFIQNIVKG